MKRTGIISVLLVVILLVSTSCASGVTQEEYDRVKNELSAIQGELSSLQGKLTESMALQALNEVLNNKLDTVQGEYEVLQAQYEELIAEYDELSGDYDNAQSEFKAMQDEYEELSAKYEELSKQVEAVVEEEEEVVEIAEEDVEQALFELINQDRIDNGLDELMWGQYRYKDATAHSRYMATSKKLEYPEFGWQEIFWATGYSTADEIANAALTVWKNRKQYEIAFLNKATLYGAVAVYQSGEIYYITYTADYFQ